ncbi:MAG: VWA domain-containing protein, partial [Planctomycetes bacterium]|nr:VWA domain-containing protein [Planctomycetota bacterium]
MDYHPPNPFSFLARVWFPLALIILLLLALPGAVLVLLNLLGRQAPVNDWLEKNFQLTYHLPLPWTGALLVLLVPLAILLLYFLKLKRKPLSVPSTFLWRKSIEDLHVNTLFQWLRENVLLLLQVLTALALIYGVLALHLHGRYGEGAHYILLIDNSASMAATEVVPNRLEQAKQEALKEIDAHTDHDFGMVITFNSSAETKQSYTSNRVLLRRAVADIRPTQRLTRIQEALALADSLANPLRSAENAASQPENVPAGTERTYVPPMGIATDLHLFSDGRFPDLSEGDLANLHSRMLGNESPLGNLNLHFHL